jgi:hypothetical protein
MAGAKRMLGQNRWRCQIYLGLAIARGSELPRKSFQEREVLMVFIKVEPKWDELRSEPRFKT